jgi:steroid 5-alpha reductase family enzyme
VTDFLVVSAAAAGVCTVAMLVGSYAARRVGRRSVTDVGWGVAHAAVALVCALIGDGSSGRRWLLAVLVSVWGVRLSWHILRRSTRHDEDPRYTELLGSGRGGPLVRVWIPQGAAIWFVSLPVQVSAVAGNGLGPVAVLGALVWLVGVVFESVGDR